MLNPPEIFEKFLFTSPSKLYDISNPPNEIVEEKSNRINLDTGAVYPELGKLSCMFIDVKKNRREFFIYD